MSLTPITLDNEDIQITPVYLIQLDGEEFMMAESTMYELMKKIQTALGIA